MLHWSSAAVVGTVLSGFAFLLVTGRYDNDGPVIVPVSEGHGVHLGDVFVIAGWAVSMALLFALTASRQQHQRDQLP